MRFDRSNAPVLLLTTLVVAAVSVGEVPRAPHAAAAADSTVVAYREQRLEWTDNRVEEVVVATPPWQAVAEEPPPANPIGSAGGDGTSSAVLATGIPETAMAAYAGAANDLARSDPGCGLRWSVIAAIGRVESNHGRYGGATLHTDGSIRPVIRGIALDGRPGVAAIGDSDDGALDGDLIFDRAMGPMQFIPSTWRGWASDGNGDGVRDPDNMFDAALAAGRYLCAGDVDTRSAEGLRSAIFRYNQSDAYVSAVISLAQAYQDNEVPVLPDIADATRVDAAPSAEAPVQVTTTPTPPSPVETTPSIPVSTTTPGAPTQSVDPAPGAVCTGAPATSSAPPSVPVTPEGPCTAPNPSG